MKPFQTEEAEVEYIRTRLIEYGAAPLGSATLTWARAIARTTRKMRDYPRTQVLFDAALACSDRFRFADPAYVGQFVSTMLNALLTATFNAKCLFAADGTTGDGAVGREYRDPEKLLG